MPVQNYLRGAPMPGQDLPEIGNLLQRKRMLDEEQQRRNALLQLDQQEFQAGQQERADLEGARRAYSDWQAFQNNPQWRAAVAQGARQKHPEWANATDDELITRMGVELQATLGITPEKAPGEIQSQNVPGYGVVVTQGGVWKAGRPNPAPPQPRTSPSPKAETPKPAEAVDARRAQSKITDAENVLTAISEAKELASGWSAGLFGQATRKMGGTPAFDLNAKINTIKANIGFDRLQRMREESKTGGALGQVAVQELEMLQSVITSLDTAQSPEQLVKALDAVAAQYQKSMQAYEAAQQEASGASGGLVPGVTKEGGYIYIGGDPANPKSWTKER